jgi:hypothetical protein
MADITRNDLSLILERAEKATEYERKCGVPEEQRHVTVSVTTLRRMVAMSLRTVSEETVRKLAEAEAAQRAYAAVERLGGDTAPALRSLNRTFDDFTRGCHADLLEAAEAVAKEGGG